MPSATNTDQTATVHVPPSSGELQRFIERRRAHELGIELPMNLAEASEYVGASADQLQSMAEAGQIPAYQVALHHDDWEFYQSELDEWLRNHFGKELATCKLQ
jgi:excisionase family DNA binding protein